MDKTYLPHTHTHTHTHTQIHTPSGKDNGTCDCIRIQCVGECVWVSRKGLKWRKHLGKAGTMLALIPPPFSALTSLWNLFPLVCDAHTHTHTHIHTHTDTCSVTCLHTRLVARSHTHTHTHTHTDASYRPVHILWGARTKKTHTYTAEGYCDRLEQESKFARGKERSLFALWLKVQQPEGRGGSRERTRRREREREREREQTGRKGEGGRGQQCCATFRPGAKTRCTWGTD